MNFKIRFGAIMIATLGSMLVGTFLIFSEDSVYRIAGSVPIMVSIFGMVWLVMHLRQVNNYTPVDNEEELKDGNI